MHLNSCELELKRLRQVVSTQCSFCLFYFSFDFHSRYKEGDEMGDFTFFCCLVALLGCFGAEGGFNSAQVAGK